MKTFAFKLAAKAPTNKERWHARDGVATAGCSIPDGMLQYLFADYDYYC